MNMSLNVDVKLLHCGNLILKLKLNRRTKLFKFVRFASNDVLTVTY